MQRFLSIYFLYFLVMLSNFTFLCSILRRYLLIIFLCCYSKLYYHFSCCSQHDSLRTIHEILFNILFNRAHEHISEIFSFNFILLQSRSQLLIQKFIAVVNLILNFLHLLLYSSSLATSKLSNLQVLS